MEMLAPISRQSPCIKFMPMEPTREPSNPEGNPAPLSLITSSRCFGAVGPKEIEIIPSCACRKGIFERIGDRLIKNKTEGNGVLQIKGNRLNLQLETNETADRKAFAKEINQFMNIFRHAHRGKRFSLIKSLMDQGHGLDALLAIADGIDRCITVKISTLRSEQPDHRLEVVLNAVVDLLDKPVLFLNQVA